MTRLTRFQSLSTVASVLRGLASVLLKGVLVLNICRVLWRTYGWRSKQTSQAGNIITEAKRNFATHSDFPVEIKDKVYKFKVLRDIWTFIGTWLTFLEIPHLLSVRLFEKVEIKKNLSQSLILEKVICPSCLFRFATLQPNVFKLTQQRLFFFIFQTNVQKFFTFQNAKMNKCLSRFFKKWPFWPFTLDD